MAVTVLTTTEIVKCLSQLILWTSPSLYSSVILKKYLMKYAYGMYEGVTMYIADSTTGLVTDFFTSTVYD